MSRTEIRYQLSVAGILRNARGEILVCERLDTKGAWQFPQGSVEPGEGMETALRREIGEEIGLKKGAYRLREQRGPYFYLYGEGRKKKGYQGKEQQYFLLELTDEDARVNLETAHPEFQDFCWIRPEEFRLNWLPDAKKEVYRQVLFDFFGLKYANSKH